MSLPAEARSHHTVWVDLPGGTRTLALRYAADGERLVCLGDDGLASVPAGTRLTAALRGIACGPEERRFWVRLEEIPADDVSLGVLSEVLGDRALGRSSAEVTHNLEQIRGSRRLVALQG